MLRTKLCGMRTIAAACTAEDAGADYIGFVFWHGSRRYVEPKSAARIAKSLHRIKKVGVFVDADAAYVNALAERCGLDYVQLHGHETADYAEQIERPVIKAYRCGDGFSAEAANGYPAAMILVDAFRPGVLGGTGKSFDWRAAKAVIAAIRKPVLIAGGIGTENVAEMAAILEPYGVDVSGSLEVDHEKSEERIRTFMKEVQRINEMEEL